MYNLVHWSDGY